MYLSCYNTPSAKSLSTQKNSFCLPYVASGQSRADGTRRHRALATRANHGQRAGGRPHTAKRQRI